MIASFFHAQNILACFFPIQLSDFNQIVLSQNTFIHSFHLILGDNCFNFTTIHIQYLLCKQESIIILQLYQCFLTSYQNVSIEEMKIRKNLCLKKRETLLNIGKKQFK